MQGSINIVAESVKGVIEAWAGGEMLHSDQSDLSNARRRQKFAEDLSRKIADPTRADEIEKLLMMRLNELRELARRKAAPTSIDVPRLVRPELFITPEVVGLSAPETVVADGRPTGRWKLYLCFRDGTREVRDLTRAIELRGGGSLYVHPFPSSPDPTTPEGWSAGGRRAWLEGRESPNAAAVFNKLCAAISRFIEFPEAEATDAVATLALWSMFTYVYHAWPALPYLFIGGPFNSGKSRVFDVLERLAFRAMTSSNLSASLLFRTLHSRGGTVLFDEAERLQSESPDVQELNSILLAGYRRQGKAHRCDKINDAFEPAAFDVYGPKAVACIRGVTDALRSRCIPIIMFRARPGSTIAKQRIDSDPSIWRGLRDDLHSLALGSLGFASLELANRSEVCDLSNRAYELWQPLMALASMIEAAGVPGLLQRIRAYASQLMQRGEEDELPAVDELVLKVLAGMFLDRERMSPPTPTEVLIGCRLKDPDTVKDWSARTVTAVLKRYGIVTKDSNGARRYQATSDQLMSIQESYRVDLGFRPPTRAP